MTLNTCTLNIRLVADAGKPVFRKKHPQQRGVANQAPCPQQQHNGASRTFSWQDIQSSKWNKVRLYSIVKADLKIAGKIRNNPKIGEVTQQKGMREFGRFGMVHFDDEYHTRQIKCTSKQGTVKTTAKHRTLLLAGIFIGHTPCIEQGMPPHCHIRDTSCTNAENKKLSENSNLPCMKILFQQIFPT